MKLLNVMSNISLKKIKLDIKQSLVFIVQQSDSGKRIDKYASSIISNTSRSLMSKYIENKCVFINGEICKQSKKVVAGDEVIINIPLAEKFHVEPENIPLDIVYEDDDILIVNKSKGMVIHPAPGHYSGTLVNALMYHMGNNLSIINGSMRPGIVHRIDRDTTGLLVICKNNMAHNHISKLLKTHNITRIYHTVVKGNISIDGVVDAKITRDPNNRKKMSVTNSNNGKNAITHYHVMKQYNGYTYISCNLETGRTHQIRVHMASIGHPVLGDCVYGGRDTRIKACLEGQTLHAKKLGFIHPRSKEYVEFDSQLPKYFNDLLSLLENL